MSQFVIIFRECHWYRIALTYFLNDYLTVRYHQNRILDLASWGQGSMTKPSRRSLDDLTLSESAHDPRPGRADTHAQPNGDYDRL